MCSETSCSGESLRSKERLLCGQEGLLRSQKRMLCSEEGMLRGEERLLWRQENDAQSKSKRLLCSEKSLLRCEEIITKIADETGAAKQQIDSSAFSALFQMLSFNV